MAVDIKVPPAVESVTEATVGRWLKPNGAAVRANEPVCELETDKATAEVMAPASGTLVITVPEGQQVAIGAVLGRVEASKAPANNSAPPAPPKKEEAPRPAPAPPAAPSPVEAPLSPSARRLVADKGIDPRELTGTGRGGLITKEDVLGHLAARQAPPQAEERAAPRDAPAAALLP